MEREEINLVKLEVNYVVFGEKKYLAKNGEEISSKTVTVNTKNTVEYTTELGEVIQRNQFSFFIADVLRFVHQHGGTDFLEAIESDNELKRLLKKAVYVIDLQVGKWPLKDVIFDEQVMRLFEETQKNAEKAFEQIANRPLAK